MEQPSFQDDIVPRLSNPPEHENGGGGRRPRSSSLLPRVAFFAGTACVLGLLLFLPIRYPSVVNTHATIAPAYRWALAKATDGQLIASTFNYKSGLSEGFRVSTFNPGGSVNFSLHPSLAPGRVVAIGDTIGSVYSTDLAEQLIALTGRLAAARGALAVSSTGQKSSVVNDAEQRLRFAYRKRDEHRMVEQRDQLLYDQHLVPQDDHDRVLSEANALQDEISIAEANRDAARTGAKPEQLDLANANITALTDDIEALERRASTYVLTAPISGIVTPAFSGDTLLTIIAPEYIALIPVRRTDYSRLAATAHPRLTLRGLSRAVHGTLIAMNRELQVISGQEVLIATALLEAPPADVMPGMLVRCRIQCTPVTALDYGKQLIRSATGTGSLLGGF